MLFTLATVCPLGTGGAEVDAFRSQGLMSFAYGIVVQSLNLVLLARDCPIAACCM